MRMAGSDPTPQSPAVGYSLSNSWLPNLRVRLFSVTVRTVCSLAPFGVRSHDLAPRLERPRARGLDERSARLALLAPHLLVEDEAPELHLHLAHLVRLGAETAVRRRAIESSAWSTSSLENGS